MNLLSEDVAVLEDLPGPIRAFLQLNVVLGFVCCVVMFGIRFLLKWSYPYDFPFLPFASWIDFVVFKARFQHFHSLQFFSDAPAMGTTFEYPAPAALLYQGFYSIPRHPLPAFLVFTALAILILAIALGSAMVNRGIKPLAATVFVSASLLFSYPFWFEYLLGNMEICIFLLLAMGIISYLRNRFYAAAILIGLVASMKIFPFVFLALFLSRKRILPLAAGIATALASNLISLWLVCPSFSIAYRGIQAGLAKNRLLYMLRYLPVETGFDHSVFGLVKRVVHTSFAGNLPPSLLNIYLILSAFVGITLYFTMIRRLPVLNQILCLCIAAVLLPPTSHDYTLMHLYVPWALLVLYTVDRVVAKESVRNLFPAFLCFAILFSPESEFILHGAGFSGQIKCVTLVGLFYIALTKPCQPFSLERVGQAHAHQPKEECTS